MRKLLNKPWFVALLAFAAVLFAGSSLLERRGAASDAPTPEPLAEEVADYEGEVPSVVHGSLAEALKTLVIPGQIPDPFAPRRPRASAAEEEPKPDGSVETESVHLSAIWEQDGEVHIFVNGRICRPGETLGRITLDSVAGEGVWLTHWKGRDFLPLGQTFTLITPAAPAATPTHATHEG